MTISDRIFRKLRQLNMSQKEFSEETGISQSTISEWKSKGTNPTSEKIMIICKVLDVTPEWLLSGIGNTGTRGNDLPWFVIGRDSEIRSFVTSFLRMTARFRLVHSLSATRKRHGLHRASSCVWSCPQSSRAQRASTAAAGSSLSTKASQKEAACRCRAACSMRTEISSALLPAAS